MLRKEQRKIPKKKKIKKSETKKYREEHSEEIKAKHKARRQIEVDCQVCKCKVKKCRW